MSWTASWRTFASAALGLLAACATPPRDRLLFQDDFRSLDQWVIEAEQPARVSAAGGILDIDTPAGITLWFRPRLDGLVKIEFDATAVAQGGPNDQVSDLNVFWMAANADGSAPFASQRSGQFAEQTQRWLDSDDRGEQARCRNARLGHERDGRLGLCSRCGGKGECRSKRGCRRGRKRGCRRERGLCGDGKRWRDGCWCGWPNSERGHCSSRRQACSHQLRLRDYAREGQRPTRVQRHASNEPG